MYICNMCVCVCFSMFPKKEPDVDNVCQQQRQHGGCSQILSSDETLFGISKYSSVTGDKNNLQFTWLDVLLQMAGVGHVLFVISLRLAIDGWVNSSDPRSRVNDYPD